MVYLIWVNEKYNPMVLCLLIYYLASNPLNNPVLRTTIAITYWVLLSFHLGREDNKTSTASKHIYKVLSNINK